MLQTILGWLYFLFDILVPRFVTEDVALEKVGPGSGWDAYDLVMPMRLVEPGEQFDGIAEADSFTWLGFGITYRVGNFRPFRPVGA